MVRSRMGGTEPPCLASSLCSPPPSWSSGRARRPVGRSDPGPGDRPSALRSTTTPRPSSRSTGADTLVHGRPVQVGGHRRQGRPGCVESRRRAVRRRPAARGTDRPEQPRIRRQPAPGGRHPGRYRGCSPAVPHGPDPAGRGDPERALQRPAQPVGLSRPSGHNARRWRASR